MAQLNDFFNDIGLNFQIIKLYCLGKSVSNHSRPIKITLSNTSETFSVLHSQIKLREIPKWNDIHFSSDRTAKQRAFMSKLREELINLKEKGENDIIIKYLKGIPTIVSSKNI